MLAGIIVVNWVFVGAAARADDTEKARATVDQAIMAIGGEATASKYNAATSKLKGTIHIQDMDVPFEAEMSRQGTNQSRANIELEIAGQKVSFVQVFNKDKGWIKVNDMLMDLDKDKIAELTEGAHNQWLSTIVTLKDKSVTLALVGDAMVNDKPAVAIKASVKGRRDLTLFFDKATHFLVKTEGRVKDDDSGQEVTQETLLSGHTGKEVKAAVKMIIKREGKKFLEAEISDIKMLEKLDESTFDKP
jgi:hypothetical protein